MVGPEALSLSSTCSWWRLLSAPAAKALRIDPAVILRAE